MASPAHAAGVPLTVLLFDAAAVCISNGPMAAKNQEALFGREFEKLDQHRKVEILKTSGIQIGQPPKSLCAQELGTSIALRDSQLYVIGWPGIETGKPG